jgi:hypothetical protein
MRFDEQAATSDPPLLPLFGASSHPFSKHQELSRFLFACDVDRVGSGHLIDFDDLLPPVL